MEDMKPKLIPAGLTADHVRPVLIRRDRPNPNRVAAMRATAKAMWATPEGRAQYAVARENREAMRKLDPERFKRTGVPLGMTKKTVAPLWAKARQQADRFIQKMTDEGILPEVLVPDSDDAKAVAALREATVLALGPSDKQLKLAAIRTVLEWTRSKPASKSLINVNSSEDWLAEIAADNERSE